MSERKKKILIMEPQKFVACLPNYENISAGPMVKNLKRIFYHKSGTELRLEASQKIKLLT